jgi:hypothetical protein
MPQKIRTLNCLVSFLKRVHLRWEREDDGFFFCMHPPIDYCPYAQHLLLSKFSVAYHKTLTHSHPEACLYTLMLQAMKHTYVQNMGCPSCSCCDAIQFSKLSRLQVASRDQWKYFSLIHRREIWMITTMCRCGPFPTAGYLSRKGVDGLTFTFTSIISFHCWPYGMLMAWITRRSFQHKLLISGPGNHFQFHLTWLALCHQLIHSPNRIEGWQCSSGQEMSCRI